MSDMQFGVLVIIATVIVILVVAERIFHGDITENIRKKREKK